MDLGKIELLMDLYGNKKGDKVKIVKETKDFIYYYCNKHEYSSLSKKLEGKAFRYVTK